MPDKQKSKGKLGGYRPGAGRPKGSKNKKIEIDPHGSTARLEQLGFDPVEATVRMYEEVGKKIIEMEANKNVSAMAIANLYNTKEKLINNLMRYGYRQVPEKTEIEQSNFTFGVTLTDSPEEQADPTGSETSTETTIEGPSAVH